ncbi:WGR domain-containing protein [Rhodopirellula europaea]|uniref:WGR domain-containing protein n=1 Tax=Rhodopirellula europaea 6C TaxID=1263867 RepID=M2AZV3_9BACT|nr:hypothetical protein [Rhodopirellula europaea]EMB15073.1 hypothetical protein RE6C_04175 [Rhodopirellula europaea 6C]
MENLLSIAFEAHNDERNHHRSYQMDVGKDLFGDWTLKISYGRCGRGKQVQSIAATDEKQLKRVLRERILRRMSSRRRIGCDYQLVDVDCSAELAPSDWLPRDLEANSVRASDACSG